MEPHEHEPVDKLREKLESRLNSFGAIREGSIGGTGFMNERTGEIGGFVTKDTVDEAEAALRDEFSTIYPDLFPDSAADQLRAGDQ